MGDNMYTVDRIEKDLVILENRANGEILEVNVDQLEIDVKEGDILDIVDNKFIKDIIKTREVKNRIRSKFDSLKR